MKDKLFKDSVPEDIKKAYDESTLNEELKEKIREKVNDYPWGTEKEKS